MAISIITVNTLVRLPDGRLARVITAPIGTSKYVTVLIEDEPGVGRAYQVDVSQVVKA